MNTKNCALYLILWLLPFALSSQQIENPGFENWEDAGTVKDEPVDWSTIKTCDDPTIANVAPVTFDISTDAHSGNYALKLYNLEVFGISATGAICNGRFHAEFNLDSSYSYTVQDNPLWNTVFNWRPDSLVGWFKYFPQGSDAAQFKVILHVDECKLPENGTLPNWVGSAAYKTEHGVTFDTWTRFSVPFTYFDNRTPEFLLCVLNSGDSTVSVPDSYLLVDDLELKYNSSGIFDPVLQQEFLTAGERRLTITLLSEEEFINRRFSLVDLSGQVVFSKILSGNQIDIPYDLTTGIYLAALDGKEHKFVQKILIQ